VAVVPAIALMAFGLDVIVATAGWPAGHAARESLLCCRPRAFRLRSSTWRQADEHRSHCAAARARCSPRRSYCRESLVHAVTLQRYY
jgi:hypothetical protein